MLASARWRCMLLVRFRMLAMLPLCGTRWMTRCPMSNGMPLSRWHAWGRTEGVTVLARMLDREYVERNVTRTPAVDARLDPVSEVMVSGLQAVGALQAVGLRDAVQGLSENDASLGVREVAMRTLEVLEPSVAEPSTIVNANERG